MVTLKSASNELSENMKTIDHNERVTSAGHDSTKVSFYLLLSRLLIRDDFFLKLDFLNKNSHNLILPLKNTILEVNFIDRY